MTSHLQLKSDVIKIYHPSIQMRWDAKKKKYVRADVNDKKKIKTESGVWIPASYKSNRYAKWKERSKLAQMQVCYAHLGES